MDSLYCSEYIYTFPCSFLAARPIICMSAEVDLKNHCLSASIMAILETSGRSSHSLKRFTHTITSIFHSLSSLSISNLSSVSTSLCKYFTFTPFSIR